ncbi:type 4b pilus protein PilO2 [Acidovorax sp. SUPP950]|uniref:hypothetical protein n=1 Tax=Acidovorax sp. SUPP950 TaxID=511901 RepID=UPI0023D0E140|nr:hypothetical protein [Acidovorax sp. SUPP950]GKS73269.1 type 4b pilus protein PilO2 [Acidovorax sp. SUPP950]
MKWLNNSRDRAAGDPQAPGASSDARSTPAGEIVEIEGLRLAIALTWTGAESTTDGRRFAGKNNAYLVKDVGGEIIAAAGGRDVIGLLAGGAVVGHVVPNAFVYHPLPDGRFWICLIRDGMPYAGYDQVVPAVEAAQLYTNATSMAAADTRMIGDTAPASHTLDEVLAKARSLPRKELEALRLRKNGIRLRTVLTLAALAAALGAAAVVTIEHRDKLQSERKRQDMLRALLQSQQEREAEAARVASAKHAFEQTVARQRALFLTRSVVLQQWQQCETLRRRLPFSDWGYRPVKLTCDFGASMATVEWQAVNLQTRVADRARLPGILDPLDIGARIVSTFVMSPLDPTAAASRHIELKPARMAIADWGQAYLRGGMRQGVEEVVTVNPPPEIAGLDGVQSVALGFKQAIDVAATTSRDVLMLDEAMRFLSTFPITFQRMVWSSPTAPGAQFAGTSTLFIRQ